MFKFVLSSTKLWISDRLRKVSDLC